MQHRDLAEFAKLMMILSEVFDGGKVPSELKMEIYFEALKQYEIDSLKRAIERMIMVRVYPSFPKPGEIVQEIEGVKEDRAVIAWVEVVGAIRAVGPYQSVKFNDQTIHAVIEFMGGWPATGDWLEDELKWKQKEFEKLYAIMQIRGEKRSYLPGICEIKNEANGYPRRDKVIEVGKQETYKLIGEGNAPS